MGMPPYYKAFLFPIAELLADFKSNSHSLDFFEYVQDRCLEELKCKFRLICNIIFISLKNFYKLMVSFMLHISQPKAFEKS